MSKIQGQAPLTSAIGIQHYFPTGSYIKAVRLSGGSTPNIHYGWTNGFESREEAESATEGLADVWSSSRGDGQWGVTHPVNRMHESATRHNPADNGRRDICSTCNTERSVSGACMCD